MVRGRRLPNESAENVGRDLKRAHPGRVIINLRGGNDLICFRLSEQRLEVAFHRFR